MAKKEPFAECNTRTRQMIGHVSPMITVGVIAIFAEFF